MYTRLNHYFDKNSLLLKKQFDTVDHEILLNNLCFYGIKSKNMYKYENMSNRGSKAFLQTENNIQTTKKKVYPRSFTFHNLY